MNERYILAGAGNVDNKLLKPKVGTGFSTALTVLTAVFDHTVPHKNATDYWINKAEELMYNGSIEEAVLAYDKAIELTCASDTMKLAGVWQSKAETLAYADQWEEALDAQNRALELDPRNGQAWYFKAFILTNLDRLEDALAAYNKAIEQDPNDISNWQCKASLLAQMKRYSESLEAYDKAIEQIPESNTEELALTWLSKGDVLSKINKRNEARAVFQKSLELYERVIVENPDDTGLLQSKGRILFNLGRYDAAMEIYDHILDISPTTESCLTYATTWIGKGEVLLALGKSREALEAYDKAIKTGPNFSNAWYGRGEAQKALGQAHNASMSFLVAQKLGYDE